MKKALPLLCCVLFMTGFAQQTIDSTTYFDTASVTDTIDDNAFDADKESPEFDSLATYKIPSYPTYPIHDSVLHNLKKDKAFWYADIAPERQKPAQRNYSLPFYLQNWFRTLVWVIIIGAFVAVLIWFLIASDVRLFRKKPKVVHNAMDIDISEDIFAVEYERELDKAIANENYSLGVRLMYLHILRLFSERNIIDYKIERTNSDYLTQLYDTSYYKNFFRLTRNFEYVWYGKFNISAPAFEMIRQDYTKLKALL